MNIFRLFIFLLSITFSADSLSHNLIDMTKDEKAIIHYKMQWEFGGSDATLIIDGNDPNTIKIIENVKGDLKEYKIVLNQDELSKLDKTIDLYQERTFSGDRCTTTKSLRIDWYHHNEVISQDIFMDNTCKSLHKNNAIYIDELLKRKPQDASNKSLKDGTPVPGVP